MNNLSENYILFYIKRKGKVVGILSYWEAFWSVVPFRAFSQNTQRKIIEKRQQNIIEFARTHSKYYGSIIPENWKSLQDIPPTTKIDLLNNFNDVVTDPRVTIDVVKEQIGRVPADGSLFGKYVIVMTSGSTGTPLIAIQDPDFTDRDSVAVFFRGVRGALPIASITTIEDFSVETERIKRNLKLSKSIQNIVAYIDSTKPPLVVAQNLCKIHPKTIVGYSSAILLIANAVLENNMQVRAKRVFLSGEPYSDADRKKIQRAFPKARIIGMYGSTEGGVMAYECKYGHMHVNSDLSLLEAVDENFKPVPYGTPSDQTLLTCYFNHIQPLIRFTLGDRITLHKGCPCGCHDDWVKIQGRANDLLSFESGDKTIFCSPINIIIFMDQFYNDGLENFRDYQIILHKPNRLEFRLDCYDPEKRDIIFDRVTSAFKEYLLTLGIENVEFYLSELLPQFTTKSGKRRRIYIEP